MSKKGSYLLALLGKVHEKRKARRGGDEIDGSVRHLCEQLCMSPKDVFRKQANKIGPKPSPNPLQTYIDRQTGGETSSNELEKNASL